MIKFKQPNGNSIPFLYFQNRWTCLRENIINFSLRQYKWNVVWIFWIGYSFLWKTEVPFLAHFSPYLRNNGTWLWLELISTSPVQYKFNASWIIQIGCSMLPKSWKKNWFQTNIHTHASIFVRYSGIFETYPQFFCWSSLSNNYHTIL